MTDGDLLGRSIDTNVIKFHSFDSESLYCIEQVQVYEPRRHITLTSRKIEDTREDPGER